MNQRISKEEYLNLQADIIAKRKRSNQVEQAIVRREMENLIGRPLTKTIVGLFDFYFYVRRLVFQYLVRYFKSTDRLKR